MSMEARILDREEEIGQIADMETVTRTFLSLMREDLKEATSALSDREARYLVATYYQMQENRKRSTMQQSQLVSRDEPSGVLPWLIQVDMNLEVAIKNALLNYARRSVVGQWALSITGVGPIISAGLLAHCGEKVGSLPTVGHIWRFAGLDPTRKWTGAVAAKALVSAHSLKTSLDEVIRLIAEEIDVDPERLRANTDPFTRVGLVAAISRRPWNARLKVLCWKAGESFVKVSRNSNDVYGHVYAVRKLEELEKNEALEFKDQAENALASKNYSHDTEAYKYYIKGMLPPAHIHARAKRYAVKLFLSHWHHVAYESINGVPPPMPYILTQPGHVHFTAPPNWPME